MKVYGPYTRKDNRKHIIIVNDDGSRRTVSYPKWLMEQEEGRQLDPHLETVDHIDGDIHNNSNSNLRIIDRPNHCSEDAPRVIPIEFNCSWCGNKASQLPRNIASNKRQGKAGPFCGRSCAGKYGKAVQLGQITPMNRQNIDTENRDYYKTKPL